MVSFENVGKFILSDISFCIPDGIIAGVIGRSGAGKTTLIRLAGGLLSCEAGTVRTFLQDPVRRRRQIAKDIRFFSSAHPSFREDSTIADEFKKLRFVYRLDQKEFQEEYERLAGSLRFGEDAEKEIRQLSFGQRRRAELAAVLLGQARLILLDEPTVGIDEAGKQIFIEQLQKKKEGGTAVLIASENMAEIEKACDRVLLLDEGRLLYYGSRARLMRQYAPVNEILIVYRGRLPDLEDLPLIEYRIDNDRLRCRYNENVISALEIIRHVAAQTVVAEMQVVRPRLEDVVMTLR